MPSVIVIASNQAISCMLHTILEDDQHTVSHCSLDLGAVSTIRAAPPDLALVEVGLSSSALGWTIVEHLRADALLRDLPLVVYSVDRADLHDHAALLKTSTYHTLVLPATVEEIRTVVAEALAPQGAQAPHWLEATHAAATIDR